MNVLFVDDNETTLFIYRGIASQLPGCTAVCYTSSAEALEWCRKNEPEVVVVDYNMPAPNGLEFIRLFRAMPGRRRVPLIMITSAADKALRQEALALGANDFLIKPVDIVECLARLRNMLRLSESVKRLGDRPERRLRSADDTTVSVMDYQETIHKLSRVAEFRDPAARTHLLHVAHYCKALSAAIGMPVAEQELIFMAAPMHDIGKVSIPSSILIIRGRLEPDEFEVTKQHTSAGYEILTGSASAMLQTAAEIALTHHEKYDGAGYPRGLRGDQIPLAGRICAVVDAFDAMTSARSYRLTRSAEQAKAELRSRAGLHFDPRLVEAFCSLVPDIGQATVA